MTGLEKENDDVGFFKGNKIRFFVVKNRVCKPAYTATIYVDFNTGIAKYDGLIEDAVKLGFLQEVRGGYTCPTYGEGKRITYKELVKNDEIWNSFIEKFNDKSKELMEYSNSVSKELDAIEDELGKEDKDYID